MHVHRAHDERVGFATEVSGGEADDDADKQCDNTTASAYPEADAQAIEHCTDHIPAGAVGAQMRNHTVHHRLTGGEAAVHDAHSG